MATSNTTKVLGTVFIGTVVLTTFAGMMGYRGAPQPAPGGAAQPKAPPKAPAPPSQNEKDNEARQVHTFAALSTIQQNLRNPASVQWISVAASKDGQLVCVKYRAQNGFGGMAIEYAGLLGSAMLPAADVPAHCNRSDFYDMDDFAARYAEKTASK